MSHKMFLTAMLFVAVTAAVACEGQQPSGGRRVSPGTGDKGKAASLVTYTDDIQPLLKEKCLSCHSGSQKPDLSSYELAKKWADDIYKEVKAGTMPTAKKDRLAASQVAMIKSWIDGGTPQSGGDDGNDKDDDKDDNQDDGKDDDQDDGKDDDQDDGKDDADQTASVTYDGDVKRIINSYCTSCHSTGGGISPELDSKSKVVAAADEVYDSVQAGRMPRTRPLGATDKDILKKWIDGGKK